MTAIEGELQNLPLERVLQSIAAVDASGILTVQGEDDIVAVSFLSGGIVAADALNQTVEEGLGEALQNLELLSAEDFAAAARDHAGGSSGSLGELLVDRGLVSRDDLLQGLRAQTFQMMLQILTWSAGEFKFYGGDEVSYEEGFRPIPVAELLIHAIQDLGGQARLPGKVPELDAVYQPQPTAEAVRIFGPDGDGTENGTWLSRSQADFLARLDGETSAAAVARELELDDHHARFALYNLKRHDLMVFAGTAEPVSSPGIETRQPTAAEAALRAEIFTPPEPGLPPAPGAEPVPALREAGAPAAGAPAADAPAIGAPSGEMEIPEAEPPPPIALERLVVPLLAVFLVVAMVVALLARPGATLLPYPWQDNQRTALERQLRQSLFLKIDRAAKVYFLVRAHYPDSLDDLVELGLISAADLHDPAGHVLSYSTDEVGYRVELVDRRGGGAEDPGGAGVPMAEGLSTTESITGDFLLDPQWLRVGASEEAPLVLLD